MYSLWKDYDPLTNLNTCTCEVAKTYTSHNQQLKLTQFLMGMDESYNSIRNNIHKHGPLVGSICPKSLFSDTTNNI